MQEMQKQLSAIFRPRTVRTEPHRKARKLAKALASALSVEIERLEGGGFNVWPPATLDESDDPYAGDHFVHDWSAVLEHVQSYAALNHH